ncbi:HDOD domain-containing protein [bacterium]|nr:HDOD domain-containing protein [bacterium]
MSQPSVLKNILTFQSVNFEIEQNVSSERLLHAVLLENSADEAELWLAIAPLQRILDLNLIKQVLGVDVKLATPEAQQRLSRSSRPLHAVGDTQTDIPTLIDSSIKSMRTVNILNNDDDSYLYLSERALLQLASVSRCADISVPIPELARDARQRIRSIETFTSRRIKKRLDETLEIPPLPDSAQRIMKLRSNPYAEVEELAAIIETDPALSAQVVSWASSAFYAYPGTVGSVSDAIVRVLGFDLVMNLALGLSLNRSMKKPDVDDLQLQHYWQQAIMTSAVVDALVKQMPTDLRPTGGLASLSGIMHNFGYLVLAEVFLPQFQTVNEYIRVNPGVDPADIDHHVMGIDREEIAAWLMKVWDMPEEICIALRYQSKPNYDGIHAEYANLLYIATRLMRELGHYAGPKQPIDAELFDKLGLDENEARHNTLTILSKSSELTNTAVGM